ncbi:MAG TPA: elongation factor G [Deltaproteobacteria bacterium]|nr:elongation factor G [Deltaproteobacteria bacterium]
MKRNVAIIAHGGAGKTTLSEAMLFNAGATSRLGRVDDGNSVMDFEPEEHRRRISISAAVHHYDWKSHRVNIIDTPGYSNFLTETRNALNVVGGCVVILSGISGVKVQTEMVWGYANEFEVARIAFVNKMDRERANFLRAVDDMEKVLGTKGVPIQIPLAQGPDFNGVVDLISMKAYVYKDDSSGGFEVAAVPDSLASEAAELREAMVETLVETDDALTEKYLEGGEITEDELRSALREGVMTRRFTPVLCGSAYRNMAVNLLMDTINLALPSPLCKGVTRGVTKGADPVSGEEKSRGPDPDGPFSARVFKTLIDPYSGKLSIFRIYSGTVTGDSTVLNSTTGAREKLGHLFLLEGKGTREVPGAEAGDIVAVAKLKDTHTGDTLCDEKDPIVFPPLPHDNASLSYAISPKTKGDEEKLPVALAKLMEEDPSLELRRDEQTSEFILSGVGQVHLEVAVEKLKRKYGCEVELKAPRVPYKETIRSSVQVQGKYKKQSGGRGQYGDTWIEVSPLPRGAGFEFVDNIVGGVIPRQYIPAVEKGVREAMESGVLAGYPVVDVKVRLYDGSHHSVDSSEMAFKIAASMGFKKAMEKAGAVLLEPVMQMEISVPDENMGDVIGDLNSRRGKILGVEPKSGSQVIKALVPLAEIITYATDLKGMTGDRGMYSMEFSHYEEVPTHLSRKIIEQARQERDEAKA